MISWLIPSWECRLRLIVNNWLASDCKTHKLIPLYFVNDKNTFEFMPENMKTDQLVLKIGILLVNLQSDVAPVYHIYHKVSTTCFDFKCGKFELFLQISYFLRGYADNPKMFCQDNSWSTRLM